MSPFDLQRTEAILSGLGSRTFLMNNVHDDEPLLMQTRWALSYLRGPLTREQIRQISIENGTGTGSDAETPGASALQNATTARSAMGAVLGPVTTATSTTIASNEECDDTSTQRPVLPNEIRQVFVVPKAGSSGEIVYRPGLIGSGRLHFADSRSKLDCWREVARL